MSLPYIGQQILLYGSYFALVTGLVGNGLNIITFLSRRTYRKTPCTFYFLAASIFNSLYLSIMVTTRILSAGYGIDPTRTSTILCKLKSFLVYFLTLITIICSSLATIDQYLSTSQSAILRQYSNIKIAHRMVFAFITIWSLHAIPAAVFLDISSVTKSCTNTNGGFAIYTAIYLAGYLCIIPVSIMIIFGYLTYRNIHTTRALARRGADSQMARMTLHLVVSNVICLFPYGIDAAYPAITLYLNISKDADRLVRENFASAVLMAMSYFYYSASCYVFLISSSRFRRAVKDQIFRKCKTNQVVPFQQGQTFGGQSFGRQTFGGQT